MFGIKFKLNFFLTVSITCPLNCGPSEYKVIPLSVIVISILQEMDFSVEKALKIQIVC
jgi:hypothetical protein